MSISVNGLEESCSQRMIDFNVSLIKKKGGKTAALQPLKLYLWKIYAITPAFLESAPNPLKLAEQVTILPVSEVISREVIITLPE